MITEKKVTLLSLLLIVAFFIYSLGGINLPFYWDTGSFLIPASHQMAQTNDFLKYTISMTDYPHTFLLPLTLSFFFKFFNNPLPLIHLFSILVSSLFLLLLIHISKTTHSIEKYLPLFLVAAFVTNPLFLSQTDLVYFEIIGGLFRVLSIYFLSKKSYKNFVIFGLISFFIRFENGITLPLIGIFDLVFFERKNKKLLLSNILLISVTIAWFIAHFVFTGWWIFSPERYFDEKPLQALFESVSYLFLWQGRYIYTIFILLGTYFFLIHKESSLKHLLHKNKFFLLLIINSIPVFIIITKLGYFLPRYVFPVLLPFYLASYYFLKLLYAKNRYVAISLLILMPTVQYMNLENCFSHNYEDCTYVRKLLNSKITAIQYLESNHKNKLIYSYYEDSNSFNNKILGFTFDSDAVENAAVTVTIDEILTPPGWTS